MMSAFSLPTSQEMMNSENYLLNSQSLCRVSFLSRLTKNIFTNGYVVYQKYPLQQKKNGYKIDSPVARSFLPERPIVDTPRIITDIKTEYGDYYGLRCVSCLDDDSIWTNDLNNIMRLYNLNGKLLKSIRTKSWNWPWDIAVTGSEDLVFTDYIDRSVNIVETTQIKTVIRLQEWKPLNVCSTFSGDFLVVIVSYDNKKKVVRYSGYKEKQCIQYNDKGEPLYSACNFSNNKYISENRNKDICVSDCGANAVVVVNQAGKLRFRYMYTGPSSFTEQLFVLLA